MYKLHFYTCTGVNKVVNFMPNGVVLVWPLNFERSLVKSRCWYEKFLHLSIE